EAAEASSVSQKAKKRGRDQVGTLGSGNHFLEIQKVVSLLDQKTASVYGLKEGQLVIMIHCGSRGLGHQVATDYSNRALERCQKRGVKLADKELAYIGFETGLGQDYFSAMAAAANYAWVNRQVITYRVRGAFENLLGTGADGKLDLVYDVCHNIAKKERHKGRDLIVHRKGATRAFGPGRKEVPSKYQSAGQPVIIPGSMGTSSWVLKGTNQSEGLSFGSTAHGAGRQMSRNKARKKIHGSKLKEKLEKEGLVIKASSMRGLAEEGSYAYKNVNNVVDVVDKLGLAKKVARLKPLAVIKG
ncbi:MAG TPA: RtcB family protein, partial [Patescibacteria group bacterium]|nr:RtcB family protein [Patescibacteria group bacterium]